MLRKCNDFLICVGMLLVLSCLIFTVAFTTEARTEQVRIIKIKETKIIKERPIQQQQREIKNGLRRMEKKMERRERRRKGKKKNVDII